MDLRRHEVVRYSGPPLEDVEDTSPAGRLKAAEALLNGRFRLCDRTHPAIEELYRISRQRLAALYERQPPELEAITRARSALPVCLGS